MKFIREIPINKLEQKEINNLEQFGFVLVWTNDSVEVWADAVEQAA